METIKIISCPNIKLSRGMKQVEYLRKKRLYEQMERDIRICRRSNGLDFMNHGTDNMPITLELEVTEGSHEDEAQVALLDFLKNTSMTNITFEVKKKPKYRFCFKDDNLYSYPTSF